jgi:hypothetical protein
MRCHVLTTVIIMTYTPGALHRQPNNETTAIARQRLRKYAAVAQPSLGNGFVKRNNSGAIAKQRTHATIELLEAVFSVQYNTIQCQ